MLVLSARLARLVSHAQRPGRHSLPREEDQTTAVGSEDGAAAKQRGQGVWTQPKFAGKHQ